MTFTIKGWDGLQQWIGPRYTTKLAGLTAEYARRGPYALDGVARETVDMLIARGGGLAALLVGHVDVVIDAVACDANAGASGPLTFVHLSHVDMMAACASLGAAVPASAYDAARAVLSAVATRRDDERVHSHWHRGLAALALDWPQVVSAACLFWAAWIIHVRLGGQPVAAFGDALHATLYRAAGVEP